MLDPFGLPLRLVNQLHADSGGNPRLLLALARAYAERVPRGGEPLTLPPEVHTLIGTGLASLPAGAQDTLLAAALTDRPTVELLQRSGRPAAHDHIARATTAGLVVTDDTGAQVIRFTPPAAADVIAARAGAAHRVALHISLAAVVTDAAARARHHALATTDPDADLARSLTAAAESARGQGAGRLAAELHLLAAERTPAAHSADRLARLLAAARTGAAAQHPHVVHRAADAVLHADAPADARVHVRLALIDLAGQDLSGRDEIFAAAFVDAADDPALLARIRLRLAWAALLDGRPLRAEAEADRAVLHARVAADPAAEALALTVKADVARRTGRSDARAHLDHARRLPRVPPDASDGRLHLTPRFLAARFAAADDRLPEAREALLTMLAPVSHGTGEETVAVLAALAEVSARLGRCREALDFADRAVRLTRHTGSSPGPAWYSAAVAELAGGSIARAAAYAARGVLASEQEHDAVHLARHLHVLGQARLRTGDTRGGVTALRRLKDLERAQGTDAPTTLRWHADLASGLTALGELAAAEDLLRTTRTTLATGPRSPGVTAQLDRAEAALHAAHGDPDAALALLDAAATRFAALAQPLEQGHCLLQRGRVERRRRRYAPARSAVAAALTLFTRHDARPWIDQAGRHLAQSDERTLTVSEERIAAFVGQGATNQEVAARMFLSVKTIEASLTRIYRKLGIRSRTQLSTLLHTTHPTT
ncbi:LuxR C-terminal-related transcriptional regulator [Streptomyces chumphonensis]|uniref:helix-turn-helix transcriptional regulator n=1 Tax=Streptomyces chumphonensis TaxID=1214925 RepID=UPI003D758AAA